MTTLPSFDELVSTLGVDAMTRPRAASSGSSRSSPPYTPHSPPARSKSSQSVREPPHRHLARYSPYSPSPTLPSRRGSLSSASSSSSPLSSPDFDRKSPSMHGQSSPPRRRRKDNKLTVNVFGSSTDLSANAPISMFVRRKTPGASPTSAVFNGSSGDNSPTLSPMPFMLPTLPTALSANSEQFPDYDAPRPALIDHNSQSQSRLELSLSKSKSLSEIFEGVSLSSHIRRRTGIRISAPSSATLAPRPRTIHVDSA